MIKTDCNIITRLHEHGSHIDQPLHIHLTNCDKFGDIISMMQLCNMYNSVVPVNRKEHILNAVTNNYSIVDFCSNWSQLLFLKAYYIKTFQPKIKEGLKASCELVLFK